MKRTDKSIRRVINEEMKVLESFFRLKDKASFKTISEDTGLSVLVVSQRILNSFDGILAYLQTFPNPKIEAEIVEAAEHWPKIKYLFKLSEKIKGYLPEYDKVSVNKKEVLIIEFNKPTGENVLEVFVNSDDVVEVSRSAQLTSVNFFDQLECYVRLQEVMNTFSLKEAAE